MSSPDEDDDSDDGIVRGTVCHVCQAPARVAVQNERGMTIRIVFACLAHAESDAVDRAAGGANLGMRSFPPDC